MKNIFCLGLLALFLILSPPLLADENVDLELVIATDVSRSVDEEEAQLQRQGIVTAFRSKDVIAAITSGFLRKIAVAYIDYSSRDFNEVVIDWRIIKDAASAEAFAKALLDAPLTFGRRTSISDGIELAAKMILTNKIQGTRRAIDVAGDGPNNWGRLVSDVRDETIRKRITINGLPIVNDRSGGFGSRFWLPDLDLYYRGCVIGGAGAFMVVAKNFTDFARAVRKKLIFEIAGINPNKQQVNPIVKVSTVAQIGAGRTGFVYKKGCDIGERMRREFWIDDDP